MPALNKKLDVYSLDSSEINLIAVSPGDNTWPRTLAPMHPGMHRWEQGLDPGMQVDVTDDWEQWEPLSDDIKMSVVRIVLHDRGRTRIVTLREHVDF